MEAAEKAIGRTIAAYDQIAPRYLSQWRDRRVVERPLALFSALLPTGALLLDLGCGPGFDGATLRERGFAVVGIDLSRSMLHLARRHYPGRYLQADMRWLPLGPATVRGIWASASLLHLPRPFFAPVLAEAARVLAPGGLFYFSLKEGEGEGWQADACGEEAPRFFTYWQAETLDAHLAAAGWATVAAWRDEGETTAWLNRLVRR